MIRTWPGRQRPGDQKMSETMKDIIERNLLHYLDVLKDFGYRAGLFIDSGVLADDRAFADKLIGLGLPVAVDHELALAGGPANLTALNDFRWMDQVDVLVPIHFDGYGSGLIDALKAFFDACGKPMTINDQTSCGPQINESNEPISVTFRGLPLVVKPGTVLPFTYVDDPFIDFIKADIGARATTMLELCTGSGCIGISLINELPSLRRASLIDVSPYAIFCATDNFYVNKPEGFERGRIFRSNGFAKIDPEATFDLIAANPPHRDKVAKRFQDYGSADMDWCFHHDFFRHLDQHLAPGGTAYLIENGRDGFVPEVQLRSFMDGTAAEGYALSCSPIRGSEFYIAKLSRP